MASLLWLPLGVLVPALLVLARLKRCHRGPVAARSWWLITSPLWLPVAALVGFGVAWLALATVLVLGSLLR